MYTKYKLHKGKSIKVDFTALISTLDQKTKKDMNLFTIHFLESLCNGSVSHEIVCKLTSIETNSAKHTIKF